MTLILTYSSAEKIVQVSDRRLTLPDGSLYDDKSNKAVCVRCRDARFAVAYTGLARIGRKGTDLWLTDQLGAMGASRLTFHEIETNIRAVAKREVGNKIGLTFVVAGYMYGPKSHDFILPITNRPMHYQDSPMQCLHFGRKQFLLAHGMHPAISREARRRIKRHFNRGWFLNHAREEVAEELVTIIRNAASHAKYGHVIGRDCMSVSLEYKLTGFRAEYSSERQQSVSYFPYVVMHGLLIGGGNEPIFRPATDEEIAKMEQP